MFPIVGVDARQAEALEQLGAKRKFWYRDDSRRMLFKAEERGTGDDWAEKVACELCSLLGLPHVHYELAEDIQGTWPGVVCENCAPPPTTLVLGNQLLQARDPDYPAETERKYKVRQHTVDVVAAVLEMLQLPPARWLQGLPEDIDTALGVFIGYVMLDAWVANQDRHHQNWGALSVNGVAHLAPTFDHGASMARNLTDQERQERLTTQDGNRQIGAFVRKARSAFYADAVDTRPMTTLAAWRAFSIKNRKAAMIWLDKLKDVDRTAIERVLEEVPPQRMSHVCREFTQELLLANHKRLIDGDVT